MVRTGSARAGIDVSDNIAFQRREWVVQRCAWCVLGAVLVAALLGVFGNGPLSHAARSSTDGSLTVEYERFLRQRSPSHLTITAGGDGPLAVSFPNAMLEKLELREVTPHPARSEAGPEGVTLHFERTAVPGGAGVVRCTFEAIGLGRVESSLTLGGGDRVVFPQFIYP